MATTMSLIAKQTVGSGGAASVTFSNIPQTYTDLKIVASVRTTQAQIYGTTLISFNGSSSNISYLRMFGDGASAASDTGTTGVISIDDGANATSNTFSNYEAYIPNYRSANSKSYSTDSVSETNATTIYTQLLAGLWNPGTQAAITSITLTAGASANFVANSTFYLYGISNSSTQNTSVPLASGGDVIATDGTYWYHAFKTSGSFVPLKNLTADVLVVGGGAGGGSYISGGGGAGQVRAFSSQSLSATNYTCTVGAGGAGGASGAANNGVNGGSSQFASLSAAIGGGYGSPQGNGGNGASGGGATGYPNGTYVGGTGTAGYNGGNGNSDNATYTNCGGGGGAGAAGGNSTVSASGTGGAGVNTVTNWGALSSVFTSTGLGVSGYIGGGGGGGGQSGSAGAAGSGGGGIGVIGNGTPASGVANTGSGGGGSGAVSSAYNGGNGGSGLIVVRYAV